MTDDKTVVGQYQETLPVKLTLEDEQSIARLQARLAGELEELDHAMKALMAEAKIRRRALEERISAAARAIRDGVQLRPVTILVVADFSTGHAQHLRQDTNEVIAEKTRPLLPEEKQTRLFDDAPPRSQVCLGGAAAVSLGRNKALTP